MPSPIEVNLAERSKLKVNVRKEAAGATSLTQRLEATTVGSHQTCMELTLRVKTERQLGFGGRTLPPGRQGSHHGHNTKAQKRNGNILQVGIKMIYERNADLKKKNSPPFSVAFEDGLGDSQEAHLHSI